MRDYLDLLRRPGVGAVLAGQTVSRLTPGMILLAMILALRAGGYDYTMVGLIIGSHQFGVAIGSPLQGRAADVLGHRRVLLPDGVVYLAGTVTIAHGISAQWSVPNLVAIAALTGLATPPITACARAALGEMFGTGRARERAFVLTSAGVELGYLLGPLLTAVISVLIGPGAAVITAGAAATVGTLVYASGPRLAATGARIRDAGIDPWHPGGAAAMRSRGLRAMVVVYAAFAMTFGAFDLFAAAIAESVGRPSLAGGLISVIAAASLISAFVYGARIWSGSLAERMLRLLLLFLAALLLLPVVAGQLLLVAVVLACAGALIGPMNVCGFQLIDDVAPASARAEAQSWIQAAVYLGGSIGGVTAGVVIDRFGTRATMLVGVAGVAVASAVLRGAPSLRGLSDGTGPERSVAPSAP